DAEPTEQLPGEQSGTHTSHFGAGSTPAWARRRDTWLAERARLLVTTWCWDETADMAITLQALRSLDRHLAQLGGYRQQLVLGQHPHGVSDRTGTRQRHGRGEGVRATVGLHGVGHDVVHLVGVPQPAEHRLHFDFVRTQTGEFHGGA